MEEITTKLIPLCFFAYLYRSGAPVSPRSSSTVDMASHCGAKKTCLTCNVAPDPGTKILVGMASNALGRLYARCFDMPYFFEHV